MFALVSIKIMGTCACGSDSLIFRSVNMNVILFMPRNYKMKFFVFFLKKLNSAFFEII